MTVTTQNYHRIQFDSLTAYREWQRTNSRTGGGVAAAILKAALVGGLSQLILMGIGLFPLSAATSSLVIVPTFVLVSLATGILAAYWAGECVNCTQQAGEVAWLAGFWAGVFAAVLAMVLAANGVLLVDFGQGIVNLRSPEQIKLLNSIISTSTLALVGRVLGALLLYGLIASLISALVGTIGGMIYYQQHSK